LTKLIPFAAAGARGQFGQVVVAGVIGLTRYGPDKCQWSKIKAIGEI